MKLKAESGKPINTKLTLTPKKFPGPKKDDLSGLVIGGMEVLGYFGPANDHGSQWVCRCQCGRYEVRRSKPLKKHDPKKTNLCTVCNQAK